MPNRLRCHCRWLSHPSAFAMKASTANSSSSRLMNSPRIHSGSPARWPRRNWQWPETSRAAHRGNDAAERSGFIGDACNQAHDVAPAPASGSADQRLTLDG
jgi:hypothetical protein